MNSESSSVEVKHGSYVTLNNQDDEGNKIRNARVMYVILAVAVLIDTLAQDDIREAGVSTVVTMQANGSESKDVFFRFSSFFGITPVIQAIVLFIYHIVNESFGIQLFYATTLQSILSNIMKNLYHYPRPYWYDIHVEAKECASTFGMPSGHAMESLILYANIAIYVQSQVSSKVTMFIVWIFCLYMICSVGVSRVYLGVHFLDQIIMGWILSISCITTTIGWEKTIKTMYKKSRQHNRAWAWWTGLFLFIFVMCLFSYFIVLDASIDSNYAIAAAYWCDIHGEYVIDKRKSFLTAVSMLAFLVSFSIGHLTLCKRYHSDWFHIPFRFQVIRVLMAYILCILSYGSFYLFVDEYNIDPLVLLILSLLVYAFCGFSISYIPSAVLYYFVHETTLHTPTDVLLLQQSRTHIVDE